MTPDLLIHKLFIFLLIVALFSCDEPEVPTEDNSAFITTVFRYVYAPGQHAANVLPADSANFTGNPSETNSTVFLGGFGGYIEAGFDHNVINHDGPDFEVFAMKSSAPEPAVVYVMQDTNGDGKPNEIWYQLKGSQYENSKHAYWVRYYKAKSGDSNISWLDSEGVRGELKSGYGATNTSGWWWPATITDSITFYGTRLPDSYENTGAGEAQFWAVPAGKFEWGYAENNSGTDYDKENGSNKLDISNAVDPQGNSVSLSHIRFIKIQSAVFQQAGWLNEVSPEVTGAKEIKSTSPQPSP